MKPKGKGMGKKKAMFSGLLMRMKMMMRMMKE